MAETTKIAWATSTWNPWIGCSKVASGCLNCYAEADFDRRRKRVVWGPHGTRVKTSDAYWRKPIKWNREAGTLEHLGGTNRPRVFPSLCDPFESSPLIPDEWRKDMFKLIDATPNLDWLLLSKRPENVLRMWPTVQGRHYVAEAGAMNDYQLNSRDNVWLIYSASDQQSLETGLSHLLKCRDLVPVLGLSLEPLIGPIDLNACWHGGFPCPGSGSYVAGPHWVIVGGESGPNARPCALEWIDDIRRQCEAANTPCFIKQMGSNPVTENANVWDFDYLGKRIGAAWGRSAAGCKINFDDSKGADPSEWPEEFRVQQFPK